MTEHKATPEQWYGIERFAKDCFYASCILELRSRVKALEAAAIIDVEACLSEVSFLNSQALADRVRSARRPKPPSLEMAPDE